MRKILCTCPPMVLQIDRFKGLFDSLHWEVVCPQFEQTLSVPELLEMVPKYDGWIIGDDPACEEVLQAGRAGKLCAAVKWGAGVDNVDFEAANILNIPIVNTPGTFAEEVSDVAVGYLIGLARGLFQVDRGVRNNHWPKPPGMTLKSKKVGVVGLGHIGKALVRKLKAFEMTVFGYDPFVSPDDFDELTLNDWPNGIEELDFVVLCCSLNSQNRHMINTSTLQRLKQSCYLINVGRGGLINEADLVTALEQSKLGGAALEVMEEEPLPSSSPLRSFNNVLFGSHNSSNTIEAVIRTSEIAINTLKNFLENE